MTKRLIIGLGIFLAGILCATLFLRTDPSSPAKSEWTEPGREAPHSRTEMETPEPTLANEPSRSESPIDISAHPHHFQTSPSVPSRTTSSATAPRSKDLSAAILTAGDSSGPLRAGRESSPSLSSATDTQIPNRQPSPVEVQPELNTSKSETAPASSGATAAYTSSSGNPSAVADTSLYRPVVTPPEPADPVAAAKEALIRTHSYDPNSPLLIQPPLSAPEADVPNIPVVLAPLGPNNTALFPEVPVLDALAEAFDNSLEEKNYHPANADAEEIWNESVRESDALFRLYYGDAAYVQMDQQRARAEFE